MTFQFKPAVREQTPLLIGLVGPSGSGKTLSALRLAKGIQKIRGGNICALDTEARRMLHYADHFKFLHMEFTPPFGSLNYCDALSAAAEECKGGVVIVDSMSHEHEGPGGYLDFHEQEVARLVSSGGFRSEMAATIPAWSKPAARRRKLINTILQLNCAFVFCFRAKEKLKIQKGKDPVQLGWQAIAGEEFSFEMTVRCLLPAGAGGVPDWSKDSFALGVPKLPKDLRSAFTENARLDEITGEKLAMWASGKAIDSAAQVPEPATAGADTSTVTTPAAAEPEEL